ncbi:MAG: pilus assembly protein PilM [Myxococcota bacterium]
MPQRVLGVDIGSWSVKAVLLETGFRGFKVVEAREVRLSDNQQEDGVSTPLRDAQQEALATLARDPALKADVVSAALPGESATTRWISLPFTDTRRIEQVIEGELADLIPFPIEDSIHDHFVATRGEGKSTTLAAATPRNRVSDRLDLLIEAGLDPKFLPLDVLQIGSLQHHVLHEESAGPPETPASNDHELLDSGPKPPKDARLLLDIGHHRCVLSAVNEDGVHHVRVLRTGGAAVTEAIARAFGVSGDEAEWTKHSSGFVSSSRHPPVDDEAQRVSDACVEGLKELVRELRRTIQMIRHERRIKLTRIDLFGGGSKLKGLSAYLGEHLQLPIGHALIFDQTVERLVEPVRAPAYALAVALALRATPKGVLPRLDFRKEEFAFAGTLQHFRARVPAMVASLGALLVLLLISVAAQYRAVIEHEARVDQLFCVVTEEVVGREICEPGLAISVMQSPESELGAFRLPRNSAYRLAAELSERVNEDLNILLTEMDITPDRITLDGEANGFDSIDQLVTAYAESPCLGDIKKSNISKKAAGDGVDFTLNMRVECP